MAEISDKELLKSFNESELETNIQDSESRLTPFSAELNEQEKQVFDRDIELEKQFGDSELEAAALGAGRGLTFGLSDQALVKLGIYTPEELSEIKKRNKISSLLGEAGATAAAVLGTGGLGAAGSGVRAATKVGQLTERAFASALASEGKKSIAREIVRKTAPAALGSAIEGAAFGVGQLVSEDALGESDLNAENIIASAGTGALFGAAAAGFFQAPKALVRPATATKQKIGKLSDPTESAFDLFGITPTKRARLKSTSPKFVEDLPQWTVDKAKLGVLTGTEELKNNIVRIRQEAGEKIGDTMRKIDEVTELNPGILPDNQTTYASIARKLDEDIVQRFENVPGFKAQLSPVKQIRDEFLDLASNPGSLKATELHSLRMKIDDLIKFDKAPGQFTLKDEALQNVRFALNDEIQNIAENATNLDIENVYGNLLKDLLDSNRDFSFASRLLPNIEKKVEREAAKRGIFNLTDALTGGALLDTPGLAGIALGTKKLLESDMRRRIAVLSSVERQNKKVVNKINSGISNFIKASQLPARTAVTKALVSSNLSINEDTKRKPASRAEAFENIKNNIISLSTNPIKVEEIVARRTVHLNNVAPNITAAAVETAIRGVQFLASKLPKSVTDVDPAPMFTKRTPQPSDFQLAKFERYLEAVENPLSAVDDLNTGTLTREAAEALQAVYPKIFSQIQEKTVNELQAQKDPVPYNKRVQLGILLDIPTDPSLQPENIAGLQENLALIAEQNAPASRGPTPARADKLTVAERRETKANRIAQR